jgi:hypothetical protein
MISIGPYLLFVEDKATALDAARALNRLAARKSLPHQGYVEVDGKRIKYELRDVPLQARFS